MRYAIIDGENASSGLVVNVIEANPGFTLPGKTLVPTVNAGPGWSWLGNGSFSAPPEPAPTPEAVAAAAEALRQQALKDDPLYANLILPLKSSTPAQIATYIDNNVTDLASARTMLKRMALVLARLARQLNGS